MIYYYHSLKTKLLVLMSENELFNKIIFQNYLGVRFMIEVKCLKQTD